ncbi:MAG: hypothetical protein LQ340_003803 [Diploschistes diacapsis]|nr:MAG: hypothetical protein LQ340_003803 [Diploschistes diacapsis]
MADSSLVLCQFLSPPTDLKNVTGYANVPVRYKEVPSGICELNPKIKSYAGYSEVDSDQYIFWWFFETRNGDPTTAPLTIWMNGGPGSSSMIGLFQENGPCFIDINGNPYNNPYSWSNASNMLYIDQPAQTGFSYSVPIPGYINNDDGSITELKTENCPKAQEGNCGTFPLPNVKDTANSTANAAPGFWKTLQGFMGALPQYSRHGIHITTESYGGHYAPVFSSYLEAQNAAKAGHEIHLESVLIGNGWYDPLIQYQAYYNYSVRGAPGNTYDFYPFNASVAQQMHANLYSPGACVDQIEKCYAQRTNAVCNLADNFCANNVESLIYLDRDFDDIRELDPDPFPPEFYVDYLNTPKVQQAVGAFVNYTESSYAVYVAFNSTGDDGRSAHTVADMQDLIAKDLNVVMYTGDADYNCNWRGGQAVSEEISPTAFSSSSSSPSCADTDADGKVGAGRAGYANVSTSDGAVRGQVKQFENFAFVRVYYSGHEVPFYQPLLALEMLERAINGRDVQTGTEEARKGGGYRTVGTAESVFYEGNGTVQRVVVPVGATYNTTTGAPNPYKGEAMERREAGTDRSWRRRWSWI